MGVTRAGLAFRRNSAIADLPAGLATLFHAQVTEIEQPNVGEFDIRHHGDVMVQFYGDICFIFNHDLVWDYLEHQDKDVAALHAALGRPDDLVLFAQYESGGSFGYAFIDRGIRTRTRLQTSGVPHLPEILESGTPTALEKTWLDAQFYWEEDDCPEDERSRVFYKGEREMEIGEVWITAQMLYEALQQRFGVCPWYSDLEPEYRFFRIMDLPD